MGWVQGSWHGVMWPRSRLGRMSQCYGTAPADWHVIELVARMWQNRTDDFSMRWGNAEYELGKHHSQRV